jgi:hypothetical protein
LCFVVLQESRNIKLITIGRGKDVEVSDMFASL